MIGWFKSITTVDYARGVEPLGFPPFHGRLWQRNFHDTIIRNERQLTNVRAYISNNPANWAIDDENPHDP